MEGGDVHDDGCQQGERERDQDARQKQRAGDNLRDLEQRKEVARRRQAADEGAGARRHRRCGQEVQQAVQAEDDEDEAEEQAGSGGELASDGVHDDLRVDAGENPARSPVD